MATRPSDTTVLACAFDISDHLDCRILLAFDREYPLSPVPLPVIKPKNSNSTPEDSDQRP